MLRPDNATLEEIFEAAIKEQDADLGVNRLNQEFDKLERRARAMKGKKGPFTYGSGKTIKVTIEVPASPKVASNLAYMDDDVIFFGVQTNVEEFADQAAEEAADPSNA